MVRLRGGGGRKTILRGGGGRGRIDRGGRRLPPIDLGGGGSFEGKIGYLDVEEANQKGWTGTRILLGTRLSPRLLAFKDFMEEGVASAVSPFDSTVTGGADGEVNNHVEGLGDLVSLDLGCLNKGSALEGDVEKVNEGRVADVVLPAVEEGGRREERDFFGKSCLWKVDGALNGVIKDKTAVFEATYGEEISALMEDTCGKEKNPAVSLDGEVIFSANSNLRGIYYSPKNNTPSLAENTLYHNGDHSEIILHGGAMDGSCARVDSRENLLLAENQQGGAEQAGNY